MPICVRIGIVNTLQLLPPCRGRALGSCPGGAACRDVALNMQVETIFVDGLRTVTTNSPVDATATTAIGSASDRARR